MRKRKLLFTLLMGVLILFAAQRAYFVKSDALNEIYSDLIFTRLAVEAQQYTRQIEYGLENGKELENFYHMQSILSDIKRCSSYINGAYIVSEDCRLIYSSADEAGKAPAAVKVPVGNSLFSVCKSADGGYYLSVAVYGQGAIAAGYLILDVGHDITGGALSEFDRENLIRASVVGVLSFLAGTVAMIHLCRRERRLLGDCARVLSLSVCVEVAVDAAISLYRLWVTIDALIRQSVSRITMTLQNDLDAVIEKGAAVSRIYDLNDWLLESGRPIPFISYLTFDRSYKISAAVSADYTAEELMRYAAILAEITGICILAGALLCLLGAFSDRLIEKKKGSGERNADITRKRLTDLE